MVVQSAVDRNQQTALDLALRKQHAIERNLRRRDWLDGDEGVSLRDRHDADPQSLQRRRK
jgi:hypothetical protein